MTRRRRRGKRQKNKDEKKAIKLHTHKHTDTDTHSLTNGKKMKTWPRKKIELFVCKLYTYVLLAPHGSGCECNN